MHCHHSSPQDKKMTVSLRWPIDGVATLLGKLGKLRVVIHKPSTWRLVKSCGILLLFPSLLVYRLDAEGSSVGCLRSEVCYF